MLRFLIIVMAFSRISAVRKTIVTALTPKQQQYLDYIRDDNVRVLFGLGAAGTGKTYLACRGAAEISNRVIVTKPFVSVSNEEIGFLPGSLNQKVSPWVESILSNFGELHKKKVEFAPMGFMRGHSFVNTIIIADEMQNSSPEQMMMLLTRLGSNSKMIVTGDLAQKDIRGVCGIEDFLKRYRGHLGSIKQVEFDIEDIQRDEFTKDVLRIYQSESKPSVLAMYKYAVSNGNDDAAMIPK